MKHMKNFYVLIQANFEFQISIFASFDKEAYIAYDVKKTFSAFLDDALVYFRTKQTIVLEDIDELDTDFELGKLLKSWI